MGFYPIETIKQDARLRFGVNFLNPCVNHNDVACAPEDGDIRIGLRFIKNVGAALSDAKSASESGTARISARATSRGAPIQNRMS